MLYAILIFGAVFLLVVCLGILLFYRETVIERIRDVVNPQPKPKSLLASLQESGFSVSGVAERFERILPKSQAEVSIIQQRLIRAGFRNESAVKAFYGFKVLAPLALCAVSFVTGLANVSPLLVYAASLGVGFLVPDFWLGKMIEARQKRIRRGLPDVLDLLVICVEAGLSLDQATARTAEELHHALPDLCDELNVVVLEQRAGRARADAWKNMSDRTGEETVRNLVSVLVQSEQLGTSIAKTLRVHSDAMRVKRVQTVEEQAAKTSVKLVFPLVLFIFPALFVVVLGPAIILMMESFRNWGH